MSITCKNRLRHSRERALQSLLDGRCSQLESASTAGRYEVCKTATERGSGGKGGGRLLLMALAPDAVRAALPALHTVMGEA